LLNAKNGLDFAYWHGLIRLHFTLLLKSAGAKGMFAWHIV